MKIQSAVLYLLVFCQGFCSCKGQREYGAALLHLSKTIPLHVTGRIDHMDINLQDRILYVAALGNNSVEVVDLKDGSIIHTIKDLNEPQGVCYIPQHHEIFIANGGNGDCYFYNAHNFEKTVAIHLGADADDVRYDSATHELYVGYGSGGIAIIDADTHQQTGDIKLPGHPESFQIDTQFKRLYVNVPDAHMVGAIDLTTMQLIHQWKKSAPTGNFPMAIDIKRQRLFIGYRHPATLRVLNGTTGEEIARSSMAGDADDIYYDNGMAEVFVSGGDGHISIFQLAGADTYKQIANIGTVAGARTSLLIPELKLFVVAARAASGKTANLLVYRTDL